MGLQNQLNDVSSGSIPLLLVAQIATCVNYLRSMLLCIFQSLGLSRFHPNQIVQDSFFAAIGSGLAGLIVLSDQLALNNRFSYSYAVDGGGGGGGGDGGSTKCVVCQSRFRDGDQVRMLPCRHVFHRRCFEGWLDHCKFNCPLCRSPLVSERRVELTERRVGRELASWFSLP